MNTDKLDDYQVDGFIHTVKLNSPDSITPVQDSNGVARACIKECYVKKHKADGEVEDVTKMKVNPNDKAGTIWSYSEYKKAMEEIRKAAGFTDFEYQRVDMAFDCFSKDCYQRFRKLNRYLITCLAELTSASNVYCTVDLFANEQVSVAFKTRGCEAENYDKAHQMGEAGDHSRFELRLKEMSKRDQSIPMSELFVREWTERLESAINKRNTWKAQCHCNDALERLYRKEKDAFPVRFRSLTDFLTFYQDCIFSKRQLVDLLSRFPDEVSNPLYRAEWHKKHYGIEYFSQKDLNHVVSELKRAMREFFENWIWEGVPTTLFRQSATHFSGVADQPKRQNFSVEWTDLRSGLEAMPISNMVGE